jgi:Outer membrane protein beta-barrel domain
MRSRSRRVGGVLACIAAAGLSGTAWAQNRDKAWEVTPEIGWVFFGAPHLGDMTTDSTLVSPSNTQRIQEQVTSEIDDSPSYGFRFAYSFTKKQQIEFGFGGTATNGTFDVHKVVTEISPTPGVVSDQTFTENVSVDLIVAHTNYVYNFFLQHRGKVVAFASGGIGLVNSSIFGQTANPDVQPTLDELVGDENVFMYNYGGGIRFFGGEKAGFRIDVRQVRYSSGPRGDQDQLEIGLAFTIVRGGA